MKNKVVFVTGSSIGIGRETVYQFAQENATVVVTYYKEKEEAEKTYKTCQELGAASALLIKLNLMDDESILHAVDEVVQEYKKIDILVKMQEHFRGLRYKIRILGTLKHKCGQTWRAL